MKKYRDTDENHCPIQPIFIKWARRKIRQNIDQASQEGKSLRDRLFVLSESQVNQRFKLRESFEPGDIIKDLNRCGMTVIEKNLESPPEDGKLFAVRLNK